MKIDAGQLMVAVPGIPKYRFMSPEIRRSVVAAGCAIALIGASAHGQAEQVVRIALSSETGEVYLGEPLYLVVSVTNTTDTDVVLPVTWSTGRLRLRVSRGRETRIDNPFSMPVDLAAEEACTLKPRDSFAARFAVQKYLNAEGTYTFAAMLESDGWYYTQRPDRRGPVWHACWKGKVSSELLRITVEKPTEEDDIAALKCLVGPNYELAQFDLAFEYRGDVLSGEDSRFGEVIKRFPTSVYAKHCRFHLGFFNTLRFLRSGDDKYFKAAQEQLESVVADADRRFHFRDDAIILLASMFLEKGKTDEARSMLVRVREDHLDSDAIHQLPHHLREFAEGDYRAVDETGWIGSKRNVSNPWRALVFAGGGVLIVGLAAWFVLRGRRTVVQRDA